MRRVYDFSILPQCKYPNLVAEFMETGYSLRTLSEHMGLGRCEEQIVKNKLFGDESITVSEAAGLVRLFSCQMEYLFSHELTLQGDVPIAYIRHYESNKRQEEDLEMFKLAEQLRKTLKEKPYLGEIVKEVMNWTEEQARQRVSILAQLKTA